jgi:hypothetical protein
MMKKSAFAIFVACAATTAPAVADEKADKADAKRWSALALRVEQHVGEMQEETLAMFAFVCEVYDATKHKKTFSPNEVQVPSCPAMVERGLERYYGNVHLLLAEAWRAKILGGLLTWLDTPTLPAPLTARPQADLLFSREPRDGMIAGGIFAAQLLRASDGAFADAALMLGIHRAPKHKLMRHLGGRTPTVNVTNEIVTSAQQWAADRGFAILYVCPLEGDDGALRRRLTALGFRDVEDGQTVAEGYRLGKLALHEEVCEEAALMAYQTGTAPTASGAKSDDKSEL